MQVKEREKLFSVIARKGFEKIRISMKRFWGIYGNLPLYSEKLPSIWKGPK